MKKRNKILIISAIILIVIGITFLLIGLCISGHNLADYFTSKYAYAVYITLGVLTLTVLGYYIADKIRNI